MPLAESLTETPKVLVKAQRDVIGHACEVAMTASQRAKGVHNSDRGCIFRLRKQVYSGT